MEKLLRECLKDYLEAFKLNKSECLEMIKNGTEEKIWQEHAKKGAGIKLMIEATLLELKAYEN